MRAPLDFQEALAETERTPPEGPTLADRLQAYARLLALAADELAAMERGDVNKRREFSEARDELTRLIQAPAITADEEVMPGESADEDGNGAASIPLPTDLSSLLAEALEALEMHEAAERRMQDRWSLLEEDALKAVHVGGGIVSLRAGRYLERPPLDAQLDVRF